MLNIIPKFIKQEATSLSHEENRSNLQNPVLSKVATKYLPNCAQFSKAVDFFFYHRALSRLFSFFC